MKLGFITDEVSQDLKTVGKFASEFGLTAVEIRSINNRSPFEYTDEDIKELLNFKKEYGVEITSISSPLFKCDMNDVLEIERHEAEFTKLCERANILGATVIRAFDFFKNDSTVKDRAELFCNVLKTAEKYDIKIGIETENSANSFEPCGVKELLRCVNDARLGAVYDAGNEIFAVGEVNPNGYEILKPYIFDVHIKDAIIENGKPAAVKIGTGNVDFKSILKKLKADNYAGPVMLETHYRIGNTLDDSQLLRPGGNDFSCGAYEASYESMKVLKEMVESL